MATARDSKPSRSIRGGLVVHPTYALQYSTVSPEAQRFANAILPGLTRAML